MEKVLSQFGDGQALAWLLVLALGAVIGCFLSVSCVLVTRTIGTLRGSKAPRPEIDGDEEFGIRAWGAFIGLLGAFAVVLTQSWSGRSVAPQPWLLGLFAVAAFALLGGGVGRVLDRLRELPLPWSPTPGGRLAPLFELLGVALAFGIALLCAVPSLRLFLAGAVAAPLVGELLFAAWKRSRLARYWAPDFKLCLRAAVVLSMAVAWQLVLMHQHGWLPVYVLSGAYVVRALVPPLRRRFAARAARRVSGDSDASPWRKYAWMLSTTNCLVPMWCLLSLQAVPSSLKGWYIGIDVAWAAWMGAIEIGGYAFGNLFIQMLPWTPRRTMTLGLRVIAVVMVLVAALGLFWHTALSFKVTLVPVLVVGAACSVAQVAMVFVKQAARSDAERLKLMVIPSVGIYGGTGLVAGFASVVLLTTEYFGFSGGPVVLALVCAALAAAATLVVRRVPEGTALRLPFWWALKLSLCCWIEEDPQGNRQLSATRFLLTFGSALSGMAYWTTYTVIAGFGPKLWIVAVIRALGSGLATAVVLALINWLRLVERAERRFGDPWGRIVIAVLIGVVNVTGFELLAQGLSKPVPGVLVHGAPVLAAPEGQVWLLLSALFLLEKSFQALQPLQQARVVGGTDNGRLYNGGMMFYRFLSTAIASGLSIGGALRVGVKTVVWVGIAGGGGSVLLTIVEAVWSFVRAPEPEQNAPQEKGVSGELRSSSPS